MEELKELDQILHDLELDEYLNDESLPLIRKGMGILQRLKAGQHETIVIRSKFWFMRDNHTFAEIKGKNLDEIRAKAYKLAKENPCGMVCSVMVMKDDKEIRRVGKNAHVDRDGGVDLGEWLSAIIHDKDILKNLGE